MAQWQESTCQCRRQSRRRFNPWVRNVLWRRKWQTTPVFLPGEFHGLGSLAGYSLWGHKESNTTEVTQHACIFHPPEHLLCLFITCCCCCCCVASVVSDSVRPHRWQPTRLPRPWDLPGKNTGVGFHFLLQCMKVKSESEVTQSCPTLSDPMDCSLPGPSIHGSFQARVLKWGCHCLLRNRS